MSYPKVTIQSVSKTKISDKEGYDSSQVNFIFDTPVVEYKVKVAGESEENGTLIDSDDRYVSTLKNKTIAEIRLDTVRETRLIEHGLSTTIAHSNLQEGNNQVNNYGKSLDGQWTPYSDV